MYLLIMFIPFTALWNSIINIIRCAFLHSSPATCIWMLKAHFYITFLIYIALSQTHFTGISKMKESLHTLQKTKVSQNKNNENCNTYRTFWKYSVCIYQVFQTLTQYDLWTWCVQNSYCVKVWNTWYMQTEYFQNVL